MKVILIALLTTLSLTAQAENKLTTMTPGKIDFLAIGKPAMIRIRGEAQSLNGEATIKDKKVTAEFKLPIQSLSTGIELRDKHMKEKYLESEKYTDAVLKIENLELKSLEASKDEPFTGTLKLHGIEKPVAGTFSNTGSEGSQKIHAEFKIKISDHGIEIPSYAGIKVTDDVEVKIDVELKK